jgi:hypothetical protein
MAGSWQGLTHQPNFNTSTMILLSDGRVMVQEEATQHWHALSPDIHGSYVNGTWSPLADMSFWRRYYASGMLKDGRIVIIGGEQSGAGGDTNKGEIYDPVSDSWTPIPSPPGWAEVGDASCCILPDGRLMIELSRPPSALSMIPCRTRGRPLPTKPFARMRKPGCYLPTTLSSLRSASLPIALSDTAFPPILGRMKVQSRSI